MTGAFACHGEGDSLRTGIAAQAPGEWASMDGSRHQMAF